VRPSQTRRSFFALRRRRVGLRLQADKANQDMNLDDAQRKKVAAWIAEGLKLSELQSRLASELHIHMIPKDTEPLRAGASPLQASPPPPKAGTTRSAQSPASGGAAPAQAGPGPGKVSVSVDQIARPGAVVSGRVTFGDGNQAEWYFDEAGRLGLAPEQEGYRPPVGELQQFQSALERELSKLGF